MDTKGILLLFVSGTFSSYFRAKSQSPLPISFFPKKPGTVFIILHLCSLPGSLLRNKSPSLVKGPSSFLISLETKMVQRVGRGQRGHSRDQLLVSGLSEEERKVGNSLAVQWLGLWALPAKGPGSIPGQGTKTLHASEHGQNK